MKKLSKALILVLSLAVILGALAIISGAAENDVAVVGSKKYANVDDAFAAVSEKGGKVTLLADATMSQPVEINGAVEIDIVNCKLTLKTDTGFTVNGGASLTITGRGEIVTNGVAITTLNVKTEAPTVNVVGKNGIIDVTANDGLFVEAGAGTFNFKNLNVYAEGTMGGSAVFMCSKDSDAKLNFTAVEVNSVDGVASSSAIVKLEGTAKLTTNYCTFSSNRTVVGFGTYTGEGEAILANNSYFCARAKSDGSTKLHEIGAIGLYSSVSCTMTFNNSTIESSFRPICLSATSKAKVVLNDSAIKHNGIATGNIARTCTIIVNPGSMITSAKEMDALENPDYAENDQTYVIFMAGARMSKGIYDTVYKNGKTVGTRYGKEVEGEDGVVTLVLEKIPDNKNFTVIYDPIGNSEAPYLVVERTYEGDVETTPAGYDASAIIHATSNAGFPNAVAWDNGTKTQNWFYGYSMPVESFLTWNPNGLISGASINGNDAFKLTKDEPNSDGKNNTTLFFGDGKGYSTGAYKVFVYEFDVAFTSEEGILPGSINLGARDSNNKNSMSGTNINILADGSVEYGTYKSSVKLDEWNHITIVAFTEKARYGDSHVYINGEYVGRGNAYDAKSENDTANIWGLRYDAFPGNVTKDSAAIYFDNQIFYGYTELKAGADNHLDYSVTAGMPLNTGSLTNKVSVGGIGFSTVDEALAVADEIGACATLIGDMKGQLIRNNGTVITNGYTLEWVNGSYNPVVTYDQEENVFSYTFNASYENLYVNYKWFIGNPDSITDLRNENKYVTTQVALGSVPTPPMFTMLTQKVGQTFYNADVLGWSTNIDATEGDKFAAVSVADIVNNATTAIKVFPICTEYTKVTGYDLVVLDEYGMFSRGINCAGTIYADDWFSSEDESINLGYGETLVLMTGDIKWAGSFDAPRTENGAEKTFGIDLNGYTMTVDAASNAADADKVPSVFHVLTGETMYFYSSVEGGTVSVYGLKASGSGYTVSGGSLFSLRGAGENVTDIEASLGEKGHNAHLYVGTVERFGNTYAGSNLTINADCLVELVNGDKTCTANVDGVAIVRNIVTADFALFTNYYSSAILNVNNSYIFLPKANSYIFHGDSSGMKDYDGDGKIAKADYTKAEADGNTTYRAAAEFYFNGCYIFTNANSKNNYTGNISKDDYTLKVVNFTDCTTNGRIGPSILGVTRICNGNLVYNPSATKAENVDKAKYDRYMTFGKYTDEKTLTVRHVSGYIANGDGTYTYTYTEFTYAQNGETGDIVLPYFNNKYVTPDNVYTVTVLDTEGNEVSKSEYAVGGYPIVSTYPDIYNGTAVSHVFAGYAPYLPDGIYEDVTLTPAFESVSVIEGVKVNVALDSEFIVNLRIPVAYEQYVTSVANGGVALTVEKENGYLVVRVPVLVKNAGGKINFAVNLKEGEYTAEYTLSFSIADYLEEILKNEESAYTAAERTLAWYTANYASEAIRYFGKKTDTSLAAIVETYIDAKVTLAGSEYVAIENTGLSAVFNTATVKLTESPSYVFTVKAGFVGTVSITTNAKTYTYTVEASETDTKIEIIGMKAYELDGKLVITAEGAIGDSAAVVDEGIFDLATYAAYHSANAEANEASAKALALIEALYGYANAIAAYRA